MAEHLIALLESWGIHKAASQVEYLLDFPEVLGQIWETVYAPAAATLLAYVIGLPLGILLVIGEEGGVRPLNRAVMRVLNIAVNLLRSIPFLILMALIMPLSRLIIGTSVGTVATIVPLTVAAGPYVARIVEISLREIVTKVMLPECRPSLINGATNAAITILGYGAMSGAIGGGGLGAVALMRGYGRNQLLIMYVAVILLVILVQIIQSIGTAWSVKTDRRINPTETKRSKRK